MGGSRMGLRRGLLLDRDGVVNRDDGYVGSADRFVFMPHAFSFLREAQDCGYRLAIVTNQSGVARGLYSAEAFEAVTGWMLERLQLEGITIDLALACFEHPEGKAEVYRRESFWRKPNPGMMLEAVQRLRLDPARSIALGDSVRDMEAARAAGIGLRWHLGPKEAPDSFVQKNGVLRVYDLEQAREELKDCS